MSTTSHLLDDIRNVNLSYLLLVQRLLNEDRTSAMFRLKISEQMADTLVSLPISQLAKLANSNQLLCHFSLTDATQLASLTSDQREDDLKRTHAAILLAGGSFEHEEETVGGEQQYGR
ncbi:flagellar transcriptional regulator FlhD [Kushneria aurantia]|uniref:Flagellar transcriptional regulator FlhD n=1 Tax=Kushneria aurantia TaxID=504092 RepID=A0ABV6G1I0_9GAMM|nr:flagellar transcriptional regulator FlhD [Kushneria aurantia]